MLSPVEGSLTVLQLLRDPKVGYLDPSLIIDEDIRAFDVPMDDTPFVHVVEALEDLPQEIAHERFFECAVVAQQGGEGPSGNVLQEDVEVLFVGG